MLREVKSNAVYIVERRVVDNKVIEESHVEDRRREKGSIVIKES